MRGYQSGQRNACRGHPDENSPTTHMQRAKRERTARNRNTRDGGTQRIGITDFTNVIFPPTPFSFDATPLVNLREFAEKNLKICAKDYVAFHRAVISYFVVREQNHTTITELKMI